MNESPLQTSTLWHGDLEQVYEEAVAEWLGEDDRAKAALLYKQKVFPLSCERIRLQSAEKPELSLLFVPVGTQAYAPLLGILSNPSQCIALLETKESKVWANEVEAALGDCDSVILHVEINGSDVNEIAQRMRAVFLSRGLPSGSEVGADITGGRKTMTAAVAGVGSLYGWRMFYVDGIYERTHEGLAHHEKVVEIPNLLEVFGSRKRETALSLMRAGSFKEASKLLKQISAESAASNEDIELLLLCEAAEALRQLRPDKLLACLKKNLFIERFGSQQSIVAYLASGIKDKESTRKTLLALKFILVGVMLDEGHDHPAEILTSSLLKECRVQASPDRTIRESLKRLEKKIVGPKNIGFIRKLDSLLGRGLRKRI